MQLDRTKRIYFGEETEAEMVRDKAKMADDKASIVDQSSGFFT